MWNNLRETVNSHYVWSRAVADILQVKPLPFQVDPDAMTKEALKAMAIRAFRLHQLPSSPSTPRLVYCAPHPGNISAAYMFPNGRFVTLDDDGYLKLFSANSGLLLHSLPALEERPRIRAFNKLAPVQGSMTSSYLIHYVNYFSIYPAIRKSIVRLYAVTEKFKPVVDLSCMHWVVSCSASDRNCAYAWVGPRSQFCVQLLPTQGTSYVPVGGCRIQLSGHEIEEFVYHIPRPYTISMPSDEYLVLANRLCICAYRIPRDLVDDMVLMPFWKHVTLTPYRSHDPYITIIPPTPGQHNQLRFTLYDAGTAHMIQISPTPLMHEVALFPYYHNVPFFHLGAASVLTADDPPKKFHSNCPFALFLYAHRLDSLTHRLQSDSLITQSSLKLYGDTENHYPTVLSWDEDSGLLLFVSLSHVIVYNVL
ncbi:hypothetical protein HGRIS_011943 [Hohenbuehelia grisea]|uniref:Uncharacterized protein n=2 Tax=Hohenbuehelia grisea TaxID=104357 RepID=A0ABR3JYV7_9AGAR